MACLKGSWALARWQRLVATISEYVADNGLYKAAEEVGDRLAAVRAAREHELRELEQDIWRLVKPFLCFMRLRRAKP